ncbi:MAG: hypothetical protein V5A72_02585 [Candidatus Nanohaloarchaea archaeon]
MTAGNILLGRAEIRVAKSADYISTTGESLSSSDSVGRAQDCKLKNVQKFEDLKRIGSLLVVRRNLTDFGVSLGVTLLNVDWTSIAFLFGNQDPFTSSDEIKFTPSNFMSGGLNEWRVEAVFVYPNKEDKLVLIFPRATLMNPSDPSLVNLSEPGNIGFEFSAINAQNPIWNDAELGKIVFGKV